MKVALHICCAVCATSAAERLLQAGHQVCGLFCNPNIYPEAEHSKRLENARIVAKQMSFSLTEFPYNPEEWSQRVKGLEKEPEGGRRCPVCFRLRLEKTWQFMQESGCQAFTTTLTMGSNKSLVTIGQIGEEIGGTAFLKHDFKKREGFKRAGELARQWGIYRQHYCGCEYSLREASTRQVGKVKDEAI